MPQGASHRECDHPSTRQARSRCREAVWRGLKAPLPLAGHAQCTHPSTEVADAACRRQRSKSARVTRADTQVRETTAVEVDPELLSWVSDFVHAKERVTIEDVSREFFPRSTTAPRLYLGQLVADRVIEYKARQQVYEWAYRSPRRRKPKVASNDHGYL